MPRGPAPGWRARKEPVLDAWILASVEKAGGFGRHHPQTGHYATLTIRDLADREQAAEYSRALYRCAHYLNRTGQYPVAMSADRPKRNGKGWELSFRTVDKTLARKHVLERYGPDRSKWPYDPRRRGGGLWTRKSFKTGSLITRQRVTRQCVTRVSARTRTSWPA